MSELEINTSKLTNASRKLILLVDFMTASNFLPAELKVYLTLYQTKKNWIGPHRKHLQMTK